MPEPRPLLTVAVPTHNRADCLAVLLEALLPELRALPQVELMISDNGSPDGTKKTVQAFMDRGLPCRYLRFESNVGPDANFRRCYSDARGKYVWICGDDDVPFPGTLSRLVRELSAREYDLVFMAPLGFVEQPNERGGANANTRARSYSRPEPFLRTVGLFGDLALITSVIVNKDTVDAIPHAPFDKGDGTNLVQMGWTFTALRRMRNGLVFDRGLYAVCERDPSRPFDVVKVFGANWHRMADLFLERGSRLWNAVLNDQLYSWFVANWFGMRRAGFDRNTPDPPRQMRRFYGLRASYWLFAWPLLAWPMPFAAGWLAGLRALRAVQRNWIRRRMVLSRVPSGAKN